MKIRSITFFVEPELPFESAGWESLRRALLAAREAFEAAGYPVQTARLATVPLIAMLPDPVVSAALELAGTLEKLGLESGFDYLSLGPALPERPESFDLVLPVLASTRQTFLAGIVADGAGISFPALRRSAEIIQQASRITPDGFSNLRFAVLSNVPAGTPFFPAAYHAGGSPAFALATEAADLAVEAVSTATSLVEARKSLLAGIEMHAARLSTIAEGLQGDSLHFAGIDFTLAPFPDKLTSLGTAIERLGVGSAGLHGSLAAAAFLAETLDRAQYQRAGFNGLMLPVLEDHTLASRAADGHLSVKDLLLYSTVCGTGLDTVPLPGDVTVEQLYALLLDVAFLSQRLAKPLTARLMPIPGKKAGDPTGFDFPYFANSRVLEIEAQAIHGLLAGGELLDLRPRA